MQKNRLLGPWRRSVQWCISLLILLLPWGRIDGIGFLRVDIRSLSLHIFGATLRIEELYLLLIFCLVLVFSFLLTTLVFGRVWCGWACPQTTLSDLAEWAARRLKLNISNYRLRGPRGRKVLLQVFFIILSFVVASNLLWYFIEPRDYFVQLFRGQLHPVALGTLLVTGTGVYIDLAFLRRLICRDFCPYGRFQTVLLDTSTLVLQLPDAEAPRCIDCKSCVRCCPMEIDIRQGYQIECINCGRCLDACRRIMSKRQQPGLIGYYFGIAGEGGSALFNRRTLPLVSGLVGLLLVLIFAVWLRPEASLKVALSHQVASRRLEDGNQANFINAWIKNRSTNKTEYALSAKDLDRSRKMVLKGPTRNIVLEGGENQKIDFVLITPFSSTESRVRFILRTKDGRQITEADALITPNQSR
jgi:cytochrome c oxidase accessory protein FixG